MNIARKAQLIGTLLAIFMVGTLAQAKVWTVNKTDAGADFSTFSAAVTAAGSGDTIQFTDSAAAVYDEGNLVSLDTLNPTAAPFDLTITALNKDVVTIKGQLDMSTIGYRTFSFSNITFTRSGAGSYVGFRTNSTVLTLTDCVIDCAPAADGDWGMMVNGGVTTLNNSTIKNMLGGGSHGIQADWGGTVNCNGCTFDNFQCNVLSGWANAACTFNVDNCTFNNAPQLKAIAWAAISMCPGTANVTNSTFSSATGLIFAPYPFGTAPVTANFKNCTLTITGDGVAVQTQPGYQFNGKFENCIFKGGWVQLYAESSTDKKAAIELNHCLLLGSTGAVTFGPGFDVYTIKNSIVDAAGGGSGLSQGDGNITFDEDYNLINKGGYLLGANDLDGRSAEIDPLFVNKAAGNYHLTEFSPCLGKGVATTLATDFEGKDRPNPVGSDPDLGPFESFLVPVELSSFSAE